MYKKKTEYEIRISLVGWEMSIRERSGEVISEKLKIAIMQKGLQDLQIQGHTVLHAGRLFTLDALRHEVQSVISTSPAIPARPPLSLLYHSYTPYPDVPLSPFLPTSISLHSHSPPLILLLLC